MLIEKRTLNSKTFHLGGRKYALDASIGSIHYKDNPRDEAEQWKDIDTTIIDGRVTKAPYDLDIYLTGMPGFHYKSKESGEFDVRLKTARQVIRRSPERAEELTPIIPTPKIEGNKVIWENIYPDTDVVLIAGNNGVLLQRILKSAESPLEYDVDIQEVQEGITRLLPLKPAIDANGQQLAMVETKIAGGRTEKLKLEVLDIEAKPITYPIVDATVLDEYVGASADDGHTREDGSVWDNDESRIYAGEYWASGKEDQLWARFDNVTIPDGATIGTSYLSLYVDYKDAGNKEVVSADDQSDPAAPANYADHRGRARTTANSGAWEVAAIDDYQNSPSITDVIQELVNSYDYSAGDHAIQILVDRHATCSSYCGISARSYDNVVNIPKLHIEYESGGGETLYGQAILAGVGSTTILAKKISRGAVLFEGVGNLTAIGNAIAAQVTLYGQALLAGVGNLTVLGKRTLKGTTTLAGVGNLTASAKKILRGTTILAGVGNLTTVGKKVLRGVSVLAGVGTLTAVGKTTKGGKVVLAGVGTLTATGYSKVIRKVISLSVKLHSRALSVALHGRSLTAKLYSRSLSTLLHKRSLDTKLKDRSITVKTRSKV